MAQGRRRGFVSWFVEPYKQVRLGLIFLLLNLFFSGAIFSLFGYYVLDIYDTVAGYFRLTGAEQEFTLAKFRLPIIAGGVLLASFVITTILASVRYTHRIYGPLVSINRFLDELLGGQPASPIQVREGDQLKDLVTKLNSLSERLGMDQRANSMRAIHRYLDDILAGKNPGPLRLREGDSLADLASKLSQLATRLASK